MNNHEVKKEVSIRSQNHEYVTRETTGKGLQVIGILLIIVCLVIYGIGEYQARQEPDYGSVIVDVGGGR